MEGILELRVARWNMDWITAGADEMDDDGDDDAFSKRVMGPWGILQLLTIAAATCYLMDAVTHFACGAREEEEEAENHSGDHHYHNSKQARDDRFNWFGMFLFGFASLCDLTAALLDYADTDANQYPTFLDQKRSVATYLAAYLFLFSALFTLTRNRNATSKLLCNSNPLSSSSNTTTTTATPYHDLQKEASLVTKISVNDQTSTPLTIHERRVALMLLLADLVFLVVTLIDVGLAHADSPKESDRKWLRVAQVSLVSALLWLVDSILYLIADIVDQLVEI